MTNQELIGKALASRLAEIDVRQELLAQIREIDLRGAWKEEGFKSIREFCLKELGYEAASLREVLLGTGGILTSARLSDVNPEVQTRIDRLRAWRSEKAKVERVPAFRILANRTLLSLAREAPKSVEELRKIHGIGEKKLLTFGAEILARLNFPIER
jgi:superfamily II DNA helicase RecQ